MREGGGEREKRKREKERRWKLDTVDATLAAKVMRWRARLGESMEDHTVNKGPCSVRSLIQEGKMPKFHRFSCVS